MIFRQGDPPGSLYLIEDGRVRVFRDVDGTRTYLASVGAGEYFGEGSALTGRPHSATVEAVTTCRLLVLGAETVQRLADALPESRARLDERISQYDYKERARTPSDIDQEILPAGADAQAQVGDDQVDQAAGDEAPADETPFEETGRFVKRRRRVQPHAVIRQIDEMDCGAACLAMVTRHFGRTVPLSRIRQLVNTGRDGTSPRSLCSAAEELGLAARSVKASSQGNAMSVEAPCAGAVVKLHVRNRGAVVHEGDTLAEVVCAGERLQAALLLPERGMALVRVGQHVKLRYDAFPYQRYGVHYGTLRWLSPASTVGPRGASFRAFADLEDESVGVQGQRRPVLPGMSGRAAVIVGRRSLANYAFEPLRQIRESQATGPGDRRED